MSLKVGEFGNLDERFKMNLLYDVQEGWLTMKIREKKPRKRALSLNVPARAGAEYAGL